MRRERFQQMADRLLLLAGFGTGLAMILLGLGERFSRAIPQGALAEWFGTGFFQVLGVADGRVGWGLVLLGTFWLAACSALSVRHGWGYWSVMAAALASLPFFPGGVVTAIIAATVLGFSRPRSDPGTPRPEVSS
jgi:hypothetical protein